MKLGMDFVPPDLFPSIANLNVTYIAVCVRRVLLYCASALLSADEMNR